MSDRLRSLLASRWGRYRQRLARGHAALGRPEDALRHAAAAVRSLQHVPDRSADLIEAWETVATCQQELGQLAAAAAARRRMVDLVDRVVPNTAAGTFAHARLADLVRLQGHFD